MEFKYYSSNLFKYVGREMIPIMYNIYNIFFITINPKPLYLLYIWTGKLVN